LIRRSPISGRDTDHLRLAFLLLLTARMQATGISRRLSIGAEFIESGDVQFRVWSPRAFQAHLSQSCIGSIIEIFDAEARFTLRAWVKTEYAP
jgi:hypothetical protein